MPLASFNTLPTEIVVQVFESLHNVKDVTALNAASTKFCNVWRENTVSISDAVFSRTIKGYDKAIELVEIQQKVLQRKTSDDDGRDGQMLERNKLILSNARECFYFYKTGDVWASERGLSSDEALWSNIYYCFCMVEFLEEDALAQSPCLASLDLENLEVMFYFISWYLAKHFASFHMDGSTSSGKIPLTVGLEKSGGKPVECAVVCFHDRLRKHVLVLNRPKWRWMGSKECGA